MNRTNNHNISLATIKAIIVGSYAWLTAVSFGLVLLDIVYAGLVPDASTAFSEASDFLLFINVLTMLAALGAIGSSMEVKAARNFLVTSLIILILSFPLHMLLSSILENGSSFGPVIRIILTGSVSILAFAGFYIYCRDPLIKISYV